jgi:hypothetical protein
LTSSSYPARRPPSSADWGDVGLVDGEGLGEPVYDVLAQAVTQAQQAGRLRADLALTDVLLLMDACAHVADGTSGLDPALRRRFMAVVFDGMRAANGTTLPRISRAAPVDSWLAVYQTRPASGPSTAH